MFITLCTEACSAKGRRLPERKGSGEGTAKAAFYRPCPECTKPMNRHLFAPGSKVILDTCREHGVWLDEGEWPHLAAFLRDGGLAKAGIEVVPFLRQHFAPIHEKASVPLPPSLMHAQSDFADVNSSQGIGWLLVDVLFAALDAATDD